VLISSELRHLCHRLDHGRPMDLHRLPGPRSYGPSSPSFPFKIIHYPIKFGESYTETLGLLANSSLAPDFEFDLKSNP
jgi:hypothetical protein